MYSLVDVLARTNRFRVEDLAENRQGRLTNAQKFRLWRRILQPVLIFALVLLVFAALFVALVAVDENGYYLRAVLRESGWRIGLILLALLFLTVAFLWRSSKLILDLRDGSVASAEGHVAKVFSTYYRGSAMFYVINDLRFKVSNQAYNALVEHVTYRIFYTPRSKFLVSIEPTGEQNVSQQQENTRAGLTTGALHISRLPEQVPRDRNPYLRSGLAWYFGLMLLGIVVGGIVYLFSQSPTKNAVRHQTGDAQHVRTVAGQK
jgi:hypothetical protein